MHLFKRRRRSMTNAFIHLLYTHKTPENILSNICGKWRLRSACASAPSHQSLRCPHEETLHPWTSKIRQVKILISLRIRAVWSESSLGVFALRWTHMAYLTLRWTHMSEGKILYAKAHTQDRQGQKWNVIEEGSNKYRIWQRKSSTLTVNIRTDMSEHTVYINSSFSNCSKQQSNWIYTFFASQSIFQLHYQVVKSIYLIFKAPFKKCSSGHYKTFSFHFSEMWLAILC